jgi:hypothetical protein
VHRVLGVESVCFDQLGAVDPLLPARPDQPLLLGTQVAEKPRACLPGDDCRRELAEHPPSLGADAQSRRRRVEEQQHGRVPGDGKPEPLAQRVRDEIEVAGAGARALRLRPLNVVLESVPRATRARQSQAERELGRLDEDGHLVAVVLAAVVQTVDGRTDRTAEDRARFHDRALLVATHRRRVARWSPV